jgi:hypothetical protein
VMSARRTARFRRKAWQIPNTGIIVSPNLDRNRKVATLQSTGAITIRKEGEF